MPLRLDIPQGLCYAWTRKHEDNDNDFKETIMGYTHYFNAKPTIDVFNDAKALIADSPVALGDAWGYGSPMVNAAGIKLNGSADEDKDHESFILSAGGSDDFCKTARKPYDIVVAAILISVIVHNAGVVASDGNLDDSEWIDALNFYQSVCGELSDGQLTKLKRSIG